MDRLTDIAVCLDAPLAELTSTNSTFMPVGRAGGGDGDICHIRLRKGGSVGELVPSDWRDTFLIRNACPFEGDDSMTPFSRGGGGGLSASP